jgi:hypothetical protein
MSGSADTSKVFLNHRAQDRNNFRENMPEHNGCSYRRVLDRFYFQMTKRFD